MVLATDSVRWINQLLGTVNDGRPLCPNLTFLEIQPGMAHAHASSIPIFASSRPLIKFRLEEDDSDSPHSVIGTLRTLHCNAPHIRNLDMPQTCYSEYLEIFTNLTTLTIGPISARQWLNLEACPFLRDVTFAKHDLYCNLIGEPSSVILPALQTLSMDGAENCGSWISLVIRYTTMPGLRTFHIRDPIAEPHLTEYGEFIPSLYHRSPLLQDVLGLAVTE